MQIRYNIQVDSSGDWTSEYKQIHTLLLLLEDPLLISRGPVKSTPVYVKAGS